MNPVPHYIWLVRLDIPDEKEAQFNAIYDSEHLPNISEVPGVIDAQRYVLDKPVHGVQKYVAIYRVTSPTIPSSPEWQAASAKGRWAEAIRPYVLNASLSLYRAIP